ncbi:MAG: RNA polymerase sigma factor [Planctomycetes bacterium]|nr:RNA polymerase sigma factor [Planctomycetota bacterium]
MRDPPAPPPTFLEALAAIAPDLYAWAHLRLRGALRNRLEPAELVQEVAVRACLKQHTFDAGLGNFRGWLFGIANRVWLETLRELARDPLSGPRRLGGDTVLAEVLDSVTPITQRIAAQDGLRAAMARLDELEPEDRQLLGLIGIEGLGHAEVAAILGIAVDASRKRWQRLRERLRGDRDLAAWLLDR